MPDVTDLDDDNDGILDTDEGCIVSNDTSGTNLIANGSFDESVGLSKIPSSWTQGLTANAPDVNDLNCPVLCGLTYVASSPSTVTVSSDGGTWIGFHDTPTSNYTESIGQTVTLQAGETYSISFEQAHFGAESDPYYFTNPGKIEVLIDNDVIGNGGIMSVGTGWNTQTISYTPTTSGPHTLSFRPVSTSFDNRGAYVVLDGVGIFQTTSLSSSLGSSTLFCQDTDNDGTPDHLDTDADGDGCSDAVEAGFTDADENGQVDGTGIDADGLVTGGDGYTAPADTDVLYSRPLREVSVVNCGVSNPNCPVSTGGIMLLPQEVGAMKKFLTGWG